MNLNISWLLLPLTGAGVYLWHAGVLSRLESFEIAAGVLGIALVWQIIHMIARRTRPCAPAAKLRTPPSFANKPFAGTVRYVCDGDTVDVFSRGRVVRVRLFGIDAPELGQPHGDDAHFHLRKMAQGLEVNVHPVTVDKYNRVVAFVGAPGNSINLRMIQDGMAWATPHSDTPSEYHGAQRMAMDARRGLWHRGENAVAPWDWRADNRVCG